MGNLIEDIVADKEEKIRNGVHEVYHKKDIAAGFLLLARIAGVISLIAALGVTAFTAIVSLATAIAGNPRESIKIMSVVWRSKDDILDFTRGAGSSLNERYQNLTSGQKKCVQTLVLFVAGQLDWDDFI